MDDAANRSVPSYDYDVSRSIDVPRFEDENCDISASLGAELEASGLDMGLSFFRTSNKGDDPADSVPCRAGTSGENARGSEDDEELGLSEPRFKYGRLLNDAPKVGNSDHSVAQLSFRCSKPSERPALPSTTSLY